MHSSQQLFPQQFPALKCTFVQLHSMLVRAVVVQRNLCLSQLSAKRVFPPSEGGGHPTRADAEGGKIMIRSVVL